MRFTGQYMDISDDMKRRVWEKARAVEGYDDTRYRKDACGAWIMWDKYGLSHAFGWEIDHIYPTERGGTDILENLRPLQHQNNASKADDYPSYTAVVTAEGEHNIEKKRNLTVNAKTRDLLGRIYDIE